MLLFKYDKPFKKKHKSFFRMDDKLKQPGPCPCVMCLVIICYNEKPPNLLKELKDDHFNELEQNYTSHYLE